MIPSATLSEFGQLGEETPSGTGRLSRLDGHVVHHVQVLQPQPWVHLIPAAGPVVIGLAVECLPIACPTREVQVHLPRLLLLHLLLVMGLLGS